MMMEDHVSRAVDEAINKGNLKEAQNIVVQLMSHLTAENHSTTFAIRGQAFTAVTTSLAIEEAAQDLVQQYMSEDRYQDAYVLFVALINIFSSAQQLKSLEDRNFDIAVVDIIDGWLDKEKITPKELFAKIQRFAKSMLGITLVEPTGNRLAQWLNPAMATPGGIDFTADKTPLEVRQNGGAIAFKLDPAMIQQLQNAAGFSPVIINIQPLGSLKEFLEIGA